MDFNPNSSDAMLATILKRLDYQDQTLARIENQTTKTNGRVTKLEAIASSLKGKVIAASTGIPALFALVGWMIERGWLKIP